MLHIKNENSGFTLVELMMVIAIIGILAVIMFGVVRTAQQRAKDANIQAASANLTTALEGYYVLAGEYPDDLQKIIDLEVMELLPVLPAGCDYGSDYCGLIYVRPNKESFTLTINYVMRPQEVVTGGFREE